MARKFSHKARNPDLDPLDSGDGNPVFILGSVGDPLNGTASADFLLAETAGAINGLDGADIILGDIGEFYLEGSNGGFGAALDLDDHDTAWTLDENPLVAGDTSIPHATVYVAADPGREYFSVFVAAGETITIDIDGGGGALGGEGDCDTFVSLFHESDLVDALAFNDDSAVTDGGYGSLQGPTAGVSRDSFLTFTALASGTYYIRVGASDGGVEADFNGGEEFLLNVSVSGHVTGGAGAQGGDTIHGGDGDDQIFGAGGDDLLFGGSGIDVIDGGSGFDFVRGGGGGDMLDGGGSAGDTLDYFDSPLGVTVFLSTGYASGGDATGDVIAGFEYVHGSNIGNDILYGDAGGNLLNGLGGDDLIQGGGGSDSLAGGDGTDTVSYFSSPQGVTVILLNGSVSGGDATGDVIAGFEYVHGSNIGNDLLIGDAGGNLLNGLGGDDLIEGLGGGDSLSGGDGFDTLRYLNSPAGVTVNLATGATSGGHADGDIIAGFEGIHGSGFADTLTGNANSNYLIGFNGDDSLNGGGGGDELIGDGEEGGTGNDTLDGGSGNDIMVGGPGNDLYYVDSVGDRVVEYVGLGTDTVVASVSYKLSAGLEVETLRTPGSASTGSINLTGNELAQTIFGNAAANVIDGRAGVDTMRGYAGDDTYYVRDGGDAVIEAAGGGNDTVISYTSHVLGLGQHVELLRTPGSASTSTINLTGNELVNYLQGNAGTNSLNGGGGADTLRGYAGDDTYWIDNAGDTVIEAAGNGNDTVITSVSHTLGAGQEVETLRTLGSGTTDPVNLTGNALAQTIFGNAAANVIDGKGGADTLRGYGGADTFAFTTALGAGNIDQIVDFNVADDTIRLDDAVFAGLALGALAAGAFRNGAAALDADDRIIYNGATGQLLFDADGAGGAAAVQFATLSAGLAMTASDFTVI